MKSNGSRTFIKVTNQMIYSEIQDIKKSIGKIKGITRWHSWAISIIIVFLAAMMAYTS